MPQTLIEYDFVPTSPAFAGDEEEELEHAGWGELSMEEQARRRQMEEEESSEDESEGRREGLIDLDEVAREEMGVWGDRGGESDSDEERVSGRG
jgi:hypothetical protein